VVFLRPGIETCRVDQKAKDIRKAGFVIIEPDKARKPFLRLEVRISDTTFKQIVDRRTRAHQ
jgi:hypothetical protein